MDIIIVIGLVAVLVTQAWLGYELRKLRKAIE